MMSQLSDLTSPSTSHHASFAIETFSGKETPLSASKAISFISDSQIQSSSLSNILPTPVKSSHDTIEGYDSLDNDDSTFKSTDDGSETNDDLLFDPSVASEAASDDKSNLINLEPPILNKSEKPRSQSKLYTTRHEIRKQKRSSKYSISASSRGNSVSFESRMNELSLKKIQDLKRKFPFIKGNPQQEKHGYMWCIPCGCEVRYNINSSMLDHLNSKKHKVSIIHHEKKVIPLANSMSNYIVSLESSKTNNDIGSKKSLDTQELRMKLCYALITDGIPFNFLRSKNPNGLANLLRTHAGIDISDRAIRDMIPHVKQLELEKVKNELRNEMCFSVVFDATPNRGEAFGVIVRYINKYYEIHHRCIELKMYDRSFDQESLGKVL